MSKRGRPIAEDPRINRVEIRMSKKEADQLDRIRKDFGMSRPDAIRKLLDKYEKGE